MLSVQQRLSFVDGYSFNCRFPPDIASFSLLIVPSALQRPGDSSIGGVVWIDRCCV